MKAAISAGPAGHTDGPDMAEQTTAVSSGLKHPYHLVDPSPWPIVGAFAGGTMLFGIILQAHGYGYWVLALGLLGVLTTMFLWWRDVVRESRAAGLHTPVVRLGLRYGMALFIASEVMFFVAFFWAYFHFALFPEHVSGVAEPSWPPQGVYTFDPFSLPFLNTMILLLSGCTVTWAHHAILEGNQRDAVRGLAITVGLGVLFSVIQAYEYTLAPFPFATRLPEEGGVPGAGAYSATFFLATGFHGFHVIVGTIFLAVCLVRAMRGHFTPQRHFGFEAAAWYWHFVDVVWLFLFVCIYWWGAGEIAHH
jgi:cytochrome c oxidase subunit 3